MDSVTHANVLIVEDEAVTAMALEESLRRMGYDVVATLATGEQAVETARASHLDVVLMDIHLRGKMDGVAAAEAIRSDTQVPCVYLTAYSDDQTLKRAKLSEPYGYLVKPYNERELRAAIEIALYHSAVERDRRAAMEVIEWRDRILADVIDHSPAAIYLKDEEGRYTRVNRKFETLFGVSRAEARGKEDDRVLRAEDRAEVDALDEAVLRDGETRQGEHTLRRPDGPHQVLFTRFPLRKPNGTIHGVCGVLTDLAEFSLSEETRVEAGLRYREMVEACADAIVLTDDDGVIEYASPSCAALVGDRPEHLVGTALLGLVHPEDCARVRNALRAGSVREGRPSVTFRARTGSGHYSWVEARSQRFPRTGRGGKPLVLTVAREVTDRIAAEEESRKLRAELELRVAERAEEVQQLEERLAALARAAPREPSLR